MKKQQIINYILSLKAPDNGFFLQSGFNQKTLMSSAFSILCLELIDGIENIDKEKEAELFLNAQDSDTGLFIDSTREPLKNKSPNFEDDYFDFQTTTFTISALDALGYQPKYRFKILDDKRSFNSLREWFYQLDWSNPWHESNKVMFLLQFFSHEHIRYNEKESKSLVLYILDLLDESVDEKSGFWGTDQGASIFNAMAGAFHFYNHYKYYQRDIPYQNLAYLNTISLQERDGLFHPLGGGGACEDLDAVDMIYKMQKHDYKNEIILSRAYKSIMESQNDDGGFPWALRPRIPLNYGSQYLNPIKSNFHFGMFRWVIKRNILGSFIPLLKDSKLYRYSGSDNMKYYINKSDIWSTWFRLLALATIECQYPEIINHDIKFQFRSLPSLGWQFV